VPLGKVLDPGSVPRDGDLSNRGARFTYDYDRPDRWKHAEDVWLSGLFHYGFADDTLKVQSIDTEKKAIALAEPHLYGLASGQPWQAYYALNLLEEIDRPGEWYLDRGTGVLYLWPPSPVRRAKVSVSLLDEPMVAMEGASYVSLRGFTFEVSRGLGVYIERGTGNLVAGCTLRNLGVVGVCIGQGIKPDSRGAFYGYEVEQGREVSGEPVSRQLGHASNYLYANTAWNRNAGTNHGVVGCDIYNTGAGGISLGGGDRRTLTPAGNYVLNCDLHHFNRLDRAYRSAVNIDGVGNRVSHCLIHDAPHAALLLHGNDHVIEFNEVHRVCQLADDMGAFYMGRDPSEQGNVLRHNFWHHIGSGKGGSTCVVYQDDGSCGTTVVGNVFYKNRGTAVWINGGHDHTFRNNVFVESGAQIGSGWAKEDWKRWIKDVLIVNRLRKALDITQPPYNTRYPGLSEVYDEDVQLNRANRVWHNVSVRSGEFGTGRNDTKDNLVVSEDPGFVDAARLNFALKHDSPVFSKIPEFEPIPFAKIGLYRDEYRKALPDRSAEVQPARRPRNPKTRRFACSFADFQLGTVPEQNGWEVFGPGPDLRISQGTKTDTFDPGRVAAAVGQDSWAVVRHGAILDNSRDLVITMEAFLPAPLAGHSFFELYLNRESTWDNQAMGLAVVGGAEEGIPDSVGLRQDAAGPRVLTTERLTPGHWYRLRLLIPRGSRTGNLALMDLTGGEKQDRSLSFAERSEIAGLASGDTWSPGWSDLDSLVLRLGDGAQVRYVSIEN
ncbi:MAG: right-handed parallel beta-helix repeat-containing protein, partial [Armatimonadetes bacterium]|nr:right-handed parallel beta-helix repeat-containing protein [Armatimonadota bacterium]